MVWRVISKSEREVLFKGQYVPEYLYDFLIGMEEEKNYDYYTT